MGAGILPTAIHNNKIYFLFGKENQYEDSASGFSDFGGGTDNSETFFQTAIREGTEELTGFLGSPDHLKNMLKKYGYYTIDYKSEGYSTYRSHIFPYPYDEILPYYYNNNQRFLQKHLDQEVIKKTKIFEKEEIKWFCIDDILKRKKEFRSYFQNIIEMIYREKDKIYQFLQKAKKEKYFTKPIIHFSYRKTRKNRKITV
jgi:8-oxo-dGTP pyrophosphatase MutT (NUDIX family)